MVAMSTLFWVFVLFASMILALWRPLVGFCMVYPLLLLCPLEFSGIPVVHTPFGVLVVFTAFAALLQRKAVGRWLSSSPILVPFSLLVGVLLIFGLIGYGDPGAIGFRVRTYLMGTWPLVLAWLVLKTPRDARTVLFAALVAILVLAVGVLWVVTRQGQDVLATGSSGYNVRDFAEANEIPISYLKMMALAFCSPVWLSLLLDGVLGSKLRFFVEAAFGATVLCILISTYSSAVLALIVGTGLVLATRWWRILLNPLKYLWGILLVGLLLLGGWMVAAKLPSVQHKIDRISNPQEDASGAFRILGIWDESRAFLESPLIGHGVAAE